MNSIFVNALYLLVGNFGVRILTAFTAILLARYLDAPQYGKLMVALALVAIADFFARMSLTHTMIREGKKEGCNYKELFGGAVKLRLIFSIIATLVFIGIIRFFYKDNELQLIMYMTVIPGIWGGNFRNISEVYFQINEKMQYTAILRAVPQIIVALLLLVGIFSNGSLLFLATAYGISSSVGGIIGLVLIFRLVPGMGGWHRGLLQGLGAFVVGGVLSLFLGQLGPLMLEKVTSLEDVGYFAVAYRIPAFLYTFPGALAAAFYPQLFFYGNRDPDNHFRLTLKEIKSMTMIGICLSLPFAIYPEWVIHTFFGQRWVESSSVPLSVLAWMTVLHCMNFPLADALSTTGRQAFRTVILAVGLVCGLASYGWLGHLYGATGGAVSALVVQLVLIAGFILVNPFRNRLIIRCVLPGMILCFFAWLMGVLIRFVAPYDALGFVVIPLILLLVYIVFDGDFRELLIKTINKRRASNAKSVGADSIV